MGQVWLDSALWIGLALIASIISIRIAILVALIEIIVGALAGNAIGLTLTEWVNFLAGFGAILLAFLAGAEIDPAVVRKHFRSSLSIGVVGFFAPYLGVLAYAHYVVHWPRDRAQVAGISLSTTSVAAVAATAGVLVTTVIASAIVPTLIAQRWFQPSFRSPEAKPIGAPAPAREG